MPKKTYRHLRLRDGVWEYSFMIAGKRHRKSCFTSNVNVAMEVVEMARRAAIDASHPQGSMLSEVGERIDTTRRDWGYTWQAMRAYDADRARNLGMSETDVIKTIYPLWKHLSYFFKTDEGVTVDSVAYFVAHQQKHGLANQTIKRHLWALRRGYEWSRQKVDRLPPFPKLPRLKAKPTRRGAGNPLEGDELVSWLKELKLPARDQALIAVHTGLRRGELYRLTREHIVKGKHGVAAFLRLTEEDTKGRKARTIGLTPLVHQALLRSLPFTEDYKGSFARAAKRAGLERPRVHLRDLRHTFACVGSPFDADGTRLVMGHTTGDANSAMYYQHSLDKRIASLTLSVARELNLDALFPA